MLRNQLLLLIIFLLFISCKDKIASESEQTGRDLSQIKSTWSSSAKQDSGIRAIHVFVALCDNKYQGIVPVPAGIGNGQDAKSNLYWGAGYGVRSFFINKSNEWKLISSAKDTANNILERLLFRHKTKDVYLLADAYDGQFIRETTVDFLNASSGKNEVLIKTGGKTIYFGGASNLLAYIGHDGLMDFSLSQSFTGDSSRKRETIILACYSKKYFSSHLKKTGAKPLIWTSGLMAPEAYTLHDAINAWIENKSSQGISLAAAQAYTRYQKCGLNAARNLLVTGW
jgi:hypothetical protein